MGTFSEDAICKMCGKTFLVVALIPRRCDICPRCENPEQFNGCPE